MFYISIDGDDIGRRITAHHLANDGEALGAFASLVKAKTTEIEKLLITAGYSIIFCAADGVVAKIETVSHTGLQNLFVKIEAIGGPELTYSAGAGASLRDAYVALLNAKSNGKAQLSIYAEEK